MVNSKKIIAGLGVVAGLGVAMLPLTSYADETDTSDGYTVRVGVADTLEIESVNELWGTATTDGTSGYGTSGSGSSAVNYIAVAQGGTNVNSFAHVVKVSGSTYADYALSVYGSATTNPTSLTHTQANDTFTSTAGNLDTLAKGTWGLKVTDKLSAAPASIDTASFTGKWLAIGTQSSMTELHAVGANHTAAYEDYYGVLYGVSARDDQLAGLYEGEVTYYVTAASSL